MFKYIKWFVYARNKFKGIKMITNCEDIIIETKEFLKRKGISKYGRSSLNEFYGDVSVAIELSIDISHVDNFQESLEQLSNEDNSPLLNDGYTGIEIYEYPYSGSTAYIIDSFHVLENTENKMKFILLLKKECNHKQIDEIVEKCIQLSALGFSIRLVYSSFQREEFERRKFREI